MQQSRPRIHIKSRPVTSGSIPFAPDQLAGLALWLKADAISGLVDGDGVGTWTDSSGTGHNATQGTPANQPIYRTNVLNSKPVVRFSSGNVGMTTTLTLAVPYTIFVVYNYRGSSSFNRRAVRGVVNDWLIGPYQGFYQAQNNVLLPNPLPISGQTFVNSCVIQTGAPLTEHYTNGVLRGSNTQVRVIGQVGLGYVVNQPLDGDIAEVIAYTQALSSTDRAAVETYITAKWGV